MSRPLLIGVDWGTSSFRAFLLGAGGAVLDRVEAPAGILTVPAGTFEARMRELIGGWLARDVRLPILASGMVGSRQGWVEVPYLACPAAPQQLAAALLPLALGDGRTVWFVPGLVTRGADRIPDVMRGEETQIVGALLQRPSVRRLLLPGTHSKWAVIEAGAVAGFATFMTGELYALLCRHSILGRLMRDGGPDPEAFARGVRTGLDPETRRGGLLRRLFSARTLCLFGELADTAVGPYLSGLLIGSEIREAGAAAGDGAAAAHLVLVGGASLAEAYGAALEIAGLEAEAAGPEVTALGHWRLASLAGLVVEEGP